MGGTSTPEQRNLLKKESRALSVVTGTVGGYTVPQEWAADIFAALPQWDSVRANATVVSTSTGAPFYLPVSDDSSNTAELVGENTALSTNADPTFNQITLNAYKYSSKIVLVSRELVQDSQYSVSKFIAGVLAKRIGRLQQTHFTTGDNTNKPQGIVGAASQGKVGANGQTTSVTYDDLVDLIFSIAPAFRQKAKFMANDTTIKAIMKLKDTTNEPIFEDSKILGYEVVPNNDMPVMGVSAKSILFGDFSNYVIRDVASIWSIALTERYAEKGQVGFIAILRSDADLQDTSAVKYYQNSTT